MAETEDGYPDSPEADLDPGPDEVESLDEADREAGDEHRHLPEGRRPEGSIEDEDRRGDAHDADEVADSQAREHLLGGRGSDTANFNDNSADWSRSRR